MMWIHIAGSDREVSDQGLVRFASNKRVCSLSIKNGGYKYIAFKKNGHYRKFYVHRLVCEAFHENPLNKKQVNHIDGNRGNNIASNLEWATSSENMIHSFNSGINISRKGEHVSVATLTDEQVIEIRYLAYCGASNRTLSDAYKYDISAIRKLIKRKTWSHI